MRRLLAVITLSATILTLGAGQAGAQSGTPIYTTVYYSDATHAVQIGVVQGHCTHSGVQYILSGSHSPYYTRQLAAYCLKEGLEPIG